MFQIGALAVYPAHGVGIIESIQDREVAGLLQKFYIMRLLDTEMIIMIPTRNALNIGLRTVIDSQAVIQVFEILKERPTRLNHQTWNRRYRDYLARIRTGDTSEVGMVLRDLAGVKNNKNLSFGERKMFDTAWSLLVREIALARDVTVEEIGEELDLIFDGQGDGVLAKLDKGKRKRKRKPKAKPKA